MEAHAFPQFCCCPPPLPVAVIVSNAATIQFCIIDINKQTVWTSRKLLNQPKSEKSEFNSAVILHCYRYPRLWDGTLCIYYIGHPISSNTYKFLHPNLALRTALTQINTSVCRLSFHVLLHRFNSRSLWDTLKIAENPSRQDACEIHQHVIRIDIYTHIPSEHRVGSES